MFSLGCVIVELWRDGAPLFTLSQLFRFRAGELSIEQALVGIDDDGIRALVAQMLSRDPESRPGFDALLQYARGGTLPESFYSFLHNYIGNLNEPSVGAPHPFSAGAAPVTDRATGGANKPLPTDADHRIERIWGEFESTEPFLVPEPQGEDGADQAALGSAMSVAHRPFQDVFPVELNIPDRPSGLRGGFADGQRAAAQDGPALIILSVVCANIRNCVRPSSKLRAMDVLLALSGHLTDEAKLDRLVPYVVDLLHDEAAVVRASALRTLVQVVSNYLFPISEQTLTR